MSRGNLEINFALRGSKNYYVTLEYHYLVQGSKYEGKLKKNVPGGKKGVQKFLDKYPLESTIQVHYKPAKPEAHLSVLDKTRSYLVLSLIVFVFGFLGVISAFTAQ